MANSVEIRNKKASFEYQFLDTFVCGIVLTGTEIKSIRQGKASIQEAYCLISNGEMFIKHMNISEYEFGNQHNHHPTRDRKLLLKKQELQKLEKKLKDVGLTLIPTKLFIGERGFAKLEIALAKGKKLYDKRESIKDRDVKRDIDRKLS